MLPYILKICGFKNSIVYMFYGMYQKYTFFVKLYICGLTYRVYVRYKHKLRIDVITYIPTLANGPPSAAVCLLPGTAIIAPVPVPGVSQHPDRISGLLQRILHRRDGLLRFLVWIPPWICWMGSLLGSAVVGSLLHGVARKNFLAKSPGPIPGIRRWWVWPSGGDHNFLYSNVVLAHY